MKTSWDFYDSIVACRGNDLEGARLKADRDRQVKAATLKSNVRLRRIETAARRLIDVMGERAAGDSDIDDAFAGLESALRLVQ